MLPEWFHLKSHCHVCGSSQSGKSKFCEWCVREHVIRGDGLCLIDWHGSLFRSVLDYLSFMPPQSPVCVLDPSEPDWITPFNPFALPSGADVSAHAERMAETLVKGWGEDVRDMQRYLRVVQSVFTFCAVTGEPIQHGAKLLRREESGLRLWAIAQLGDHDSARATLMEINDATKPFEWRQLVESTENRLNAFTGSRGLTRFIGLPKRSVSIADCIREKAIVLVNLRPSPDLSRQAAKAFAAVLLSEFLFAALQNAGDPQPYYLYCDEAANYLTADAAEMLDQSLKSGIRLTVISHHENQAAFREHPEIRDSLEMNARIKCVFAGIPTELAKRYAEDFFLPEVNAEKIRRENWRWVTHYEEEEYVSQGMSDGGYATEETGGESWGSSMQSGTRYAPRQEQELAGVDVWSRDEKVSDLASRFRSLRTGECWVMTPDEVFRLDVPLIEDLHDPAGAVDFLRTLRNSQIPKHEADEIIISEAARFAERSRNAPRAKRAKKGPADLFPQG